MTGLKQATNNCNEVHKLHLEYYNMKYAGETGPKFTRTRNNKNSKTTNNNLINQLIM